MNLQELMHSVTEKKEFSELEKSDKQLVERLLDKRRFNLLLQYLNDKNIFTIGDLKSLDEKEIVALKKEIPTLVGVGDEKTQLYLKKIDELLNVKYTAEINSIQNSNLIRQYGIIGNPLKWHIEVNHLKFNNNEFVDIRKVGPDGSRGKGISLKVEEARELNRILSSELLTYNNSTMIQEEPKFYNKSLKEEILGNETRLLDKFGNEFGASIKLFIKKIESLAKDGDIVKFLNNPSIIDIKKEQYDTIHEKGMKTAIDIMNEYNKDNLDYTSVIDLMIGDKLNSMILCAMANNFNLMLGMYYNENEDYVLLKSQTSDGQYNDKWIDDRKMMYYLQNEKKDKYGSRDFSHIPNQLCRDIILNLNTHTKVYLFDRKSKKEDYVFCGEVRPISFCNQNKCIILEKIN